MTVSCYEIVTMAANGLLYRPGGPFTTDSWKERLFKRTCDKIDKFAIEIEATGLGVEIEEDASGISITLECQGMFLTGNSGPFYKIIESAKSVSFTYVDEDSIKISFGFDGIWI